MIIFEKITTEKSWQPTDPTRPNIQKKNFGFPTRPDIQNRWSVPTLGKQNDGRL